MPMDRRLPTHRGLLRNGLVRSPVSTARCRVTLAMRRVVILLRRRLVGSSPGAADRRRRHLLPARSRAAATRSTPISSRPAATPALIERLRQRWGLDQSALARLGHYLWALAHLDLGWSVTFSRPIRDVILERLPNTLLLMGSATALSFGLGSALGIVAGARPGSLRDRLLSVGSLALYAVPGFWLGLVLTVVFAVAAALAAARRHRDDRVGQDRPCPRRRHRQPSRAAGRGARLHLSRALSAHHARRHGRGLAAGFRARRPRARAVAPAHRARPCRAQRAAAARHHARPAVGRDARRQRRHRERLLRPRPRPAGAGGGRRARHAAAARHHPRQRGAGHHRQPRRRPRLRLARPAHRRSGAAA